MAKQINFTSDFDSTSVLFNRTYSLSPNIFTFAYKSIQK